jgi:hypothetical protein
LRFPMVRYVNSQRRRFIARMASLVAILVMVPAGFTFYNVFQESLFRKDATSFVEEKIASYQFSGEGRLLDNFTDIEFNDGENPLVEVVFMGNETIPENIIATWETQMNEYPKLKGTVLNIVQGSKNEAADQLKYVNELYESQKNQLSSKDEKISFLELELMRLNKGSAGQIPFPEISLEAKINYENLSRLAYSYMISTDFIKTDTIPVFEVTWKKEAKRFQTEKDVKKLHEWLKLRLLNKNLQVKEVILD